MALSEEQKDSFALQLQTLIRQRLQGQGATVPDLRDILDKLLHLIMQEVNNRTY